MEQVTISDRGQIDLPETVRKALHLDAGATLTVEVRSEQIVLSKEPPWKKLEGAAKDHPNLMADFAATRKAERDREDAGS